MLIIYYNSPNSALLFPSIQSYQIQNSSRNRAATKICENSKRTVGIFISIVGLSSEFVAVLNNVIPGRVVPSSVTGVVVLAFVGTVQKLLK